MNTKKIYVYFDHQTFPGDPELLGILSVQMNRGKEIFAFEFDKVWLKSHPEQNLDPDLQLYSLRAKTLKDAKMIFEWISRCFLQGDASIVRKKRWERRQKATSRFKVFNRNEYICRTAIHAKDQLRIVYGLRAGSLGAQTDAKA